MSLWFKIENLIAGVGNDDRREHTRKRFKKEVQRAETRMKVRERKQRLLKAMRENRKRRNPHQTPDQTPWNTKLAIQRKSKPAPPTVLTPNLTPIRFPSDRNLWQPETLDEGALALAKQNLRFLAADDPAAIRKALDTDIRAHGQLFCYKHPLQVQYEVLRQRLIEAGKPDPGVSDLNTILTDVLPRQRVAKQDAHLRQPKTYRDDAGTVVQVGFAIGKQPDEEGYTPRTPSPNLKPEPTDESIRGNSSHTWDVRLLSGREDIVASLCREAAIGTVSRLAPAASSISRKTASNSPKDKIIIGSVAGYRIDTGNPKEVELYEGPTAQDFAELAKSAARGIAPDATVAALHEDMYAFHHKASQDILPESILIGTTPFAVAGPSCSTIRTEESFRVPGSVSSTNSIANNVGTPAPWSYTRSGLPVSGSSGVSQERLLKNKESVAPRSEQSAYLMSGALPDAAPPTAGEAVAAPFDLAAEMRKAIASGGLPSVFLDDGEDEEAAEEATDQRVDSLVATKSCPDLRVRHLRSIDAADPAETIDEYHERQAARFGRSLGMGRGRGWSSWDERGVRGEGREVGRGGWSFDERFR